MNELLERFKNLKLSKKNILLIGLSAVVAVALTFGEFSGSDDELAPSENTTVYASQYTEKTEKELEKIIGNIHGAGKVSVMITLESCYENVYAKGSNVKNEQKSDSYQSEIQEEYIIVKNGSNNEECLVIKVYEPSVKGVAVVAEGADNSSVKNAIIQTVCALFDISSAKVSVEKMQTD